jgi:predicted HTH domain antitoxin
MKSITLQYPEDLPDAVHMTDAELELQMRLMAALKMFELGKLSSAKAAELAGMSRVDFLDACGRYRVGVYNPGEAAMKNELTSDANAAKDAKK